LGRLGFLHTTSYLGAHSGDERKMKNKTKEEELEAALDAFGKDLAEP
tara:strand:+ start:884 stop:1024 length:141 start_codon:yes stop_codon:yes gene_type:complete